MTSVSVETKAARTQSRTIRAGRRLLMGGIALAVLSGCSKGPPGADPGPIAPRVARLDDTSTLRLPEPASPEFCSTVQQFLAGTTLGGTNTVFTDMPEYRHSKPAANPHLVYQVVTYVGSMPVAVSCKVKTAAHLRAVYGPDAAGKQNSCSDLTRLSRAEAVGRLRTEDLGDAATRAADFVVEDNAPYATGQAYLRDFPLSFKGEDGSIHLNSPGLFQDYESWITPLLPWQFQGQHYCHLPTIDYIAALASGTLEAGTVITTVDDAIVSPQ